ncbi:MAG TPA: HigA family addiction module antitoxin [Candidatus Cybelea sp.]|nr:HigA family addiction module antitoxin [Candidatus Cybelea sp.]
MTKQTDGPPYAADPPKVAPLHPGAIVGGILEDIGVSVRSAATAMGVSHNALANLVRGDAAITPDMAVRLGAFMSNGPEGDEFWLRLQMSYDLWHARKRLKAEAAKIKPAPRNPKDAVSAA